MSRPSQFWARMGPHLGLLLAVAIWGVSFTATKVALESTSTALLVVLRFGLGALSLYVVGLWSTTQSSLRSTWRPLLLLAFVGIFLHQSLQVTALTTAKASNAGILVAVIPVWTAMLGIIVLREYLRLPQWVGVALAIAGVWIIVKPDGAAGAWMRPETFGDLLLLGSTFTWTIYTVLARRTPTLTGTLHGTAFLMAGGAVMFLPFVDWSGVSTTLASVPAAGWLAIGFLAFGASGLAYWLWNRGVAALPAHQVASYLYVEPLFAALAAAVVLSERIDVTLVAGGMLILCGVALVQLTPLWLTRRRLVPAAAVTQPAAATAVDRLENGHDPTEQR